MPSHLNEYANAASQALSISQAIHATLDPLTTKDVRRDALSYLERIRSQSYAPLHGYNLAQDKSESQAVKYYGLQLLEYAIRYRWSEYDDGQIEQLCIWIISLARDISLDDALFYRNKVGQLWVECAKRCWAEQWLDMDAALVELWEIPSPDRHPVHKVLVLYILEMLAEDICNKEDATAGLRLELLGGALNEIVIPDQLHRLQSDERGKSKHLDLRHGTQGWLARICAFAAECIKHTRIDERGAQNPLLCSAKAMNTLRALVAWISLKGIIEVNCTDCMLLALHVDNTTLQLAAFETLYTIISRPSNVHFLDSENAILQEILQSDKVSILATVWRQVSRDVDVDDTTYTLQKKTSETISVLLDSLLQHRTMTVPSQTIEALAHLSISILQSPSLLVSIPVLHSWSRLVAANDARFSNVITEALATLVGACSERLLNYEFLPEDSELFTIRQLYQDFESMPERHAFVGNYRRYCTTILEVIARQRPQDAIAHALSQIQTMLEAGPYAFSRGLDVENYSRLSLPILQFDAQFHVVLSVIKGYSAWDADCAAIHHTNPRYSMIDADRRNVLQSIRQWCSQIITVQIDDPEVNAHILKILSTMIRSTHVGQEMVLLVVEHLLSIQLPDIHATAYAEAARGFEALRVLEAQKIALSHSDELFQYFEGLETKVNELISRQAEDDRIVWAFKAFLFVVVQRTTHLDHDTKLSRLRHMTNPVFSAWQDPMLVTAIADEHSLLQLIGLGDLSTFYDLHGFAQVQDWASQQLNADGQARQAQIKLGLDKLPLRMTKAMLGATTETLKDDSDEYAMASTLWGPSIGSILPKLLQLMHHAHAFSNPGQWSQLVPQMQTVFRRTLQDRFWQSGISNESKEEFYARVSGSKSSFEGFASTVRGSIRSIREQCYHIIYLFTKFDEQFYGLVDLPEPLASSLFDDIEGLSTHHMQPVINLATGLVQRCPPHHRQSFLPPLLIRIFTKLDKKISAEWEVIVTANEQSAEDDDLSEEMRLESVLRQLTYSMVTFVAFLLDQKPGPTAMSGPSLEHVIMQDGSILEPLILFCTHALRMRDTRSCSWICKLLGAMIPAFASETGLATQVREFISTEVLKAGITSLNEPYFVDMQRDLATLLAQIITLYSPKTPTPRLVLLSLPNMHVDKVDRMISKMCQAKSARQQRALILSLFEDVRGVSIHESGKIIQAQSTRPPKIQPQYMELEQKPSIINGDETGLDSIADLFGDA